jgi:hypothetical protein
MKTKLLSVMACVFLAPVLCAACAGAPPAASPTIRRLMFAPTQAPPPMPTQTRAPAPTETPGPRYSAAFGIDYALPRAYLAQGNQTRLADVSIVNSLRRQEQSLAHLGALYFWIKREFTTWSAGGKTIGAVTAEQLLADRRLGGCHDWGLMYAALARELGYPVVMVDAMSIAWAKQFQAGQTGPHVGHVFVEVFVAGQWVLVDSTNNWYVESGYDPANPIIPLKGGVAGSNEETFGFYVMRKGVDTWGYGIRSAQELNRLMQDSARALKIDTAQSLSYTFQRFK